MSSWPCRTARSSWHATKSARSCRDSGRQPNGTARRKSSGPASFEARFAAAWWAIENGLTTEVAAELRELHALDPKHQPTARMAAILDRLDQPCTDPDFGRFQTCPGNRNEGGPRTARDPAAPAFRSRSGRADRAAGACDYRLLSCIRRAGSRVDVPRTRLVSAWFADQKDYLAFLRSEGADAFATTRGYYHPTWKAVVTFDARSTDPQRTAQQSWRRSAARFTGSARWSTRPPRGAG